jgi:AcrR family transcriptional regulator
VNSSRERNARGSGGRLRDDIVASAFALLEQTGSEDAITLRAVARGAGITAPSIYAHFADRDALLEAVIIETFAELSVALHDATTGVADPVERQYAGCRAYLRFGADRPQRYAVIFGRVWPQPDASEAPLDRESFAELPGADTFGILVTCIAECAAAGRSTSTDPFFDAAALWSALHGYSTLRTSLPSFPWPADDPMFRAIVDRLAQVSAAAGPATGGR